MFPYKTANSIEQQERKADITYLDAQLALKANLAGATLTGAYQFTAGFIAGENTVDLTGIDVNGTTYDAYAQVTNVGTAHEAQLILNRHSTTLPPRIIGARSNSETTAHTAVTAGQELLSLWGVGITSASGHHDVFGTMDFVVGTGAVSATSSPGKWVLKLTPDGAQTPAEVLSIDSDGSAAFAGSVTFASASFTAISLADGTVGAPSLRNSGDTNTGIYFSAEDTIDFTCGGTNALSLTATALTFSGTARRVYADMSNATHANRLLFQNSVVNGNSNFGVIPNGTGTVGSNNYYGSSDPDNATFLQVLALGSTETRLYVGVTGTGVYVPFKIYNSATEYFRLTTSGDIAIASGKKLLLDGVVATGNTYLYESAADTVDLYVGGTQTFQATTGVCAFADGAVGAPSITNIGDTNTGLYFSAADTIDVTTGGTRRFTIDSNGSVAIGQNGVTAGAILVLDAGITGAVLSWGVYLNSTVASDVTTQVRGFATNLSTAAAAFTTNLYHFIARQNTIGATSTVTAQAGFFATSTLTGAATNYGFFSDLAVSGTARYNFYANGTAPNYFVGDMIVVAASKLYLDGAAGAGGDTYIYESAANTLDIYSGGTNAQKITVGDTKFGHPVRLKNYTVATLPAAGTQGRVAYVTDALAPAFLTAVAGGGAVVTPVFDDGTNWVAI